LEYFQTFVDTSIYDKLREIVNIIKERIITWEFYHADYLVIGYKEGFFEVVVKGIDEDICEEKCESEIVLMFQKWCEYDVLKKD